MNNEAYELITKTMKLKPIDGPNVSLRKRTIYECLICNKHIECNGKYLNQRYKTYKSIGCADCFRKTKKNMFRTDLYEKLNEEYIIHTEMIDGLQNIIRSKGMFTRRACGHTFTSVFGDIMHCGVICPECNKIRMKTQKFVDKDGNIVKKQLQYTTEMFLEMLSKQKRKYECLNPEDYTGITCKLKFKCEKNHEWETSARYLVLQKVGCPYCAKSTYSQKAIRWLNEIMEIEHIFIQHAENGGELFIKNPNGSRGFHADGYCAKTNTVYEFNGSCYHGDPAIYQPTDYPHPYDKTITAKELYDITMEREIIIKNLGFNLITIWESEFDALSEP